MRRELRVKDLDMSLMCHNTVKQSCISHLPSLGLSSPMLNEVGERGLMISKILPGSKILCSVAVWQEVVKHWLLPRKAFGYFAH